MRPLERRTPYIGLPGRGPVGGNPTVLAGAEDPQPHNFLRARAIACPKSSSETNKRLFAPCISGAWQTQRGDANEAPRQRPRAPIALRPHGALPSHSHFVPCYGTKVQRPWHGRRRHRHAARAHRLPHAPQERARRVRATAPGAATTSAEHTARGGALGAPDAVSEGNVSAGPRFPPRRRPPARAFAGRGLPASARDCTPRRRPRATVSCSSRPSCASTRSRSSSSSHRC